MNNNYRINQACPGGTSYVIRAGDTCFSIARRFGTNVNALIAANPGIDCQNLMIGTTICIPAFCPEGTSYVIRPGDTCFNIAGRFNTTVDALIAANPGLNCLNLIPGTPICIPSFCPGGTSYVIRSGDTCFSIARRFNTNVDTLLAANPGIDCQNLMIGTTICIPVEMICPGGTSYVIRPGDTCFNIAGRFGTTVNALIAANPGLDCQNLMPGTTICIPAFCPGGTSYIVRPGDTCYSIARRFGTTVDALMAANPGINCLNLQIGQQICIM